MYFLNNETGLCQLKSVLNYWDLIKETFMF